MPIKAMGMMQSASVGSPKKKQVGTEWTPTISMPQFTIDLDDGHRMYGVNVHAGNTNTAYVNAATLNK